MNRGRFPVHINDLLANIGVVLITAWARNTKVEDIHHGNPKNLGSSPFAQQHAVLSQNDLHFGGYFHIALHVLCKVARADRRLLRCGYFPHLALRHFLVELVEKCHDSFLLCYSAAKISINFK